MNPREKKILAATLALAGLVGLYYFWWRPWSSERERIHAERGELLKQVAERNTKIAGKAVIEKRWSVMDAALKKAARDEDTALSLMAALIQLEEAHNINGSLTVAPSQDIAVAAPKGSKDKPQLFHEVVVETKFESSWDRLCDLLAGISERDELLRTRRITVRADEKNAKLDVELRVTTIERKRQ